ncbi:hypothetical protein [Bacillus sp. ISL-46]|uniref:hypothetical protein n=1 Tax=Bacillus sp. ISL-46 TaxID=2819129 RepID=UPI001BEAD2BB|nr:hypothetical protein [Bacillus sp. ISL-46]MBT2720716.1 hypothetical protein [Bacillus sp. ISL-46]
MTEVGALLDELGLNASSSHVALEELKNNLTQIIEDQKILRSKYVVALIYCHTVKRITKSGYFHQFNTPRRERRTRFLADFPLTTYLSAIHDKYWFQILP